MSPLFCLAGCSVALLLLAGPARATDGANCSLFAVKRNDAPITPTTMVDAEPGDTVEIDFFISDWGDIIEKVRIYQVSPDNAGYTSGDSGMLLPVGWDAPLGPEPCVHDSDCREGQTCHHDFNVCVGGCTSDEQCPEEFPNCDYGSCFGDDHDPEAGFFITESRADFALLGFEPRYCGVTFAKLSRYELGCVVFEFDGRTDEGVLYYAGTLILEAQEDAGGRFTLGILEDPLGEWPQKSFLGSADYITVPVPLVVKGKPLTICVPFCDCNDNDLSDADELAAGTSDDCNNNDVPDECDLADGTLHDDVAPFGIADECGACCSPEGCVQATDPFCRTFGVSRGDNTECGVGRGDCSIPIPALSEWALIALTLAGLILGTVMFNRRDVRAG